MRTMIKIQIYQDKKKEYRWRMKSKGRIIAESGEGYKRKATLKRVLNNAIESLRWWKFEFIEK